MSEAYKNQPKASSTSKSALSIAALGIVFGDIGTSPLYTLKTVILLAGGGNPNAHTIMGSVSLILWTLIIITSIKYVSFAMRIDNDGEGGILALMSLLGLKNKKRPVLIALGLMGAALIYGDGAITPAISVLSALEGLELLSPMLKNYILPSAVIILILLFMIQPKGTATIGRTFGPIMTLWFVTIGLLGIWGIVKHPAILAAINPFYGFNFLFSNLQGGFFILSGVFLCVTGAEALYADLGHFGPSPIRRAWFWLVFPSLALNYLGQAALVLDGVSTEQNIFYMLCPNFFLFPLVLLATVATIIASQSIITGAFSMTRQAMQLGWLPRLRVRQTSSEGYGQIYIGVTNWLLMIVTLSLTIGFGQAQYLAAAYGIAVSGTMLLTSTLLFFALRELWQWSLIKTGMVIGLFILVDASFLIANLTKFTSGGYIPITLAIVIYSTMYIWHRGYQAIQAQNKEKSMPVNKFLEKIKQDGIQRTPKVAVFLTREEEDIPPIISWYVKLNHVLQEKIIILKVKTLSTPGCKHNERLQFQEIAPNIWRAVANYGFMEQPNIAKLLKSLQSKGYDIDPNDITYYVGYETVITGDHKHLMPRYIESIFAFMHRNALSISDYLHLPPNSVLEIGRQIDI